MSDQTGLALSPETAWPWSLSSKVSVPSGHSSRYGAENPQQGRTASPRDLSQMNRGMVGLAPETTRALAVDAAADSAIPAARKGVLVEHFGAARNLPLVILLHGVGGPSAFYRAQAEFFTQHGYRVELPHNMDAGYGQAGTDENYAAWVGASVALALGSQGKGPDAIVEFYGSLPDHYYRNLAGMPALLLLHGERDTNIPVINAQQLLQLCVQSKFACESHIHPNEGHGFGSQAQHDAEQRTLQFLSQIPLTGLK
jgi:dienelactone hydrolase